MEDKFEDLIKYGIEDEQSDIRAHVSFPGRQIAVFRTRDMVTLLTKRKEQEREYPHRPAFQPGVSGRTAMGYCVPMDDVSPLCVLQSQTCPWDRWDMDSMSPEEKGDAAVQVVLAAIKHNHFPMWVCGIVTSDKDIDISGTDITVRASRRIQVKCDAPAWSGGTGNLYIQTHERNPLKRYGQSSRPPAIAGSSRA